MIADIGSRELLAFSTLARMSSYTLAASALGMTQSSLSKKIKELEAKLQVRLFDRTTRMVQITPEGQEFLQHAARFIDQLARSVEDVRARAAGARGRLSIAAGPHMSGNMLPPVIAEFAAKHPDVEIVLYDSQSHETLSYILSGQAEFGITVRPIDMIDHPQLDYQRVIERNVPLMAVMHRSHRLTTQADVTLSDLRREKILLLRRSSAAAQLVETALAETATSFDNIFEVSLVDTALGIAASAYGIAILPGYVSSRHREDILAYRPVRGTHVRFHIALQFLRGRSLSGAARHFAHYLQASQNSSRISP
ncbi:LysR family transcriptional regulator [Bosea sp. UC22_33]|uniref:LysR family transcriptional regulator n=1 Tax=Bosea sp. UC22_33 TaxID=3350165 RepID=UPI00366E092E